MTNDFEFEGNLDDLLGEAPNNNPSETVGEVIEETVSVPTDEFIDQTPEDSKEEDNTIDEIPDDFVSTLLSEYGIENRKITYELENGETEEKDFNDLDSSEKINILKELIAPQISQDEINAINYMRSRNVSFQEALDQAYNKGVHEASQNAVKEYTVDEYSDDELYLVDLKNKYGDMSEEEMKQDLEFAKENAELFNKKVDIIRKRYKAQEDEQLKEQARLQEEQYNNFVESVKNGLNDFNEIPMDYKDTSDERLGIEVEESQKAEVWEYILKRDEQGATQFFKDLNDPKKLVKAAWYLRFGEDLISDVTRYWKSELKKSRKEDKPKHQSQTVVTQKKDSKPVDTFNRHPFTNFVGDESLL